MKDTALQFAGVFGKILLPEKFFMYKDCFYRIDPETGLVWIVSMDQTDGFGRCIVNYDVKAFCHNLNAQSLMGGISQVQGLWQHDRERIEMDRLNRDPMYEIEVCGRVFQRLVLRPFASIGSMEDYQAFRLWNYTELLGGVPENAYWWFDEVWECVQMEQYSKAKQVFERAIEKWLRVCQQRPAMLSRPDTIRKRDDFMRLKRMFDTNDMEGIRRELENRIENSRQCLRAFFGEG